MMNNFNKYSILIYSASEGSGHEVPHLNTFKLSKVRGFRH